MLIRAPLAIASLELTWRTGSFLAVLSTAQELCLTEGLAQSKVLVGLNEAPDVVLGATGDALDRLLPQFFLLASQLDPRSVERLGILGGLVSAILATLLILSVKGRGRLQS